MEMAKRESKEPIAQPTPAASAPHLEAMPTSERMEELAIEEKNLPSLRSPRWLPTNLWQLLHDTIGDASSIQHMSPMGIFQKLLTISNSYSLKEEITKILESDAAKNLHSDMLVNIAIHSPFAMGLIFQRPILFTKLNGEQLRNIAFTDHNASYYILNETLSIDATDDRARNYLNQIWPYLMEIARNPHGCFVFHRTDLVRNFTMDQIKLVKQISSELPKHKLLSTLGVEAIFNQALNFHAQCNYVNALINFDFLLSKWPNSATLLTNRGIQLCALNCNMEALHDCELSLRLRPGDACTLHNQGVILERLGQHEKAEKCYEEALKACLSSDRSPSFEKGKLAQLIHIFPGEDFQIKPITAELFIVLVDQFEQWKNYEAASSYYVKSLKIWPNDPDTLSRCCETLLKLGNYPKLLEITNNLLKHFPNNADIFYYRGVVFKRLKRFDEASTSLHQSYLLEPNNLFTLTQYGIVLLNLRNNDTQAVTYLKEAAEGGHRIAQGNLAFCYHQGRGVEKDVYQAATWYQKAAKRGFSWAQEQLDKLLAEHHYLNDFLAITASKSTSSSETTSLLDKKEGKSADNKTQPPSHPSGSSSSSSSSGNAQPSAQVLADSLATLISPSRSTSSGATALSNAAASTSPRVKRL
jgi:tetratricopeptide (TPR) repeat protein